MKKSFLLLLLLATSCLHAQILKPGFDKAEYMEMLKISAHFGDSAYVAGNPKPQFHDYVYRAPVVGLDNCWELWISKQQRVAVVSLRGTTTNTESWLANFYAAMVPAKGTLKLNGNDSFPYDLAQNPHAAVHIGWLLGTAYLSKTILPKMDSCYKAGIKDVIILGHSQGGAIAFLLTSHLYSLQHQNLLPADIRFKTYCSAGPKPGNLYYAYDYEARTYGGWAFNVVNSADWVPETPFSIQTLQDFNKTNPFVNAKDIIKKQKFPNRVVLKYVYKKLSKPTEKGRKNYEKYLGDKAGEMVQKQLPGYEPPPYAPTNHYVRTGHTIVLAADAEYYLKYPDSETNIFAHHFHMPYLYLTEKMPAPNPKMETNK